MVKDYAESILQAVEIVVGKCLNDVAYDKTEICTILSDKDKKNGRYTVTNGSTKFDAFVDTSHNAEAIPEYKIDDSVRVSIPNGDYSQKKYIQGLNIVDNDTCPITYVSPLDTVLDMTDNIISGEKLRGLRANDVNQSEWCIWSADCSQPAYRKLQNNGLYDTIAIKADFKTLLTGYNVNSGSYGLRLDMYFKPTNGTDKLVRHSAYLDSSDMYGNPYSFLIYSTQAVKFSIANIGTIQTISLYFYQKNNFTFLDDDGIQQYLPILREEDPDYSNLLMRNVYLSFGSDIINIDDNTVKLYTNEPLEYDRLSEDESTNTKGIGLLWYNKNEDGQYLGFSDGIVDRDYDEIAYLQLSEKDSRLLAQQGKDVPLDESGLDLSADIVEAEILLNKLKNSITQDLYQMIWAFSSRIEGVINDSKNNNLADYFTLLTNSQTGLITTAGKQLEKDIPAIVNYYLARLSNARAKVDDKEYKATQLTYTSPDEMMENSRAVINAITSTDKDALGLLPAAYDTIKNQYAGFMSIYDSFNSKLTKLVAKTQKHIDDFIQLMQGNDVRLNAYFGNDYTYNPYVTQVDETRYENRYCIYWYRYIPGYVDETERFMESGWKRLTEAKDFDRLSTSSTKVYNHGLPSTSITIDGIEHYDKRPGLGEDVITRVLDTELSEEKYCVVLFYNHTMYKSSPLIFTNQNPPQDGNASDQTGALYIEHSTNSRDTYQSYGVNNMLINVADAYQTRSLMARYEGILGEEEVLLDGQIFWYIPKNATMLTYDLNDYGTNFSNDIYDSVQSPNSLEGYTCFYRKIKEGNESLTFSYHIKDYYMPTSTNNEIICKVITKDNRTIEANILFTFSSYGTSGTDYTLVIAPAGFQNAITGEAHEEKLTGEDPEIKYFDFDISLYDYNNEEIDLTYGSIPAEYAQGPKFIGPSQAPYKAKWLPEGLGPDTPETPITGCRVWIPDREFGPEASKDGGSAKSDYYYGIMQVVTEFTIPEMKNEDGVVTQKERTVNLTSVCAVPYTDKDSLYQGQVYIEGPSIIVYDSSGANPTYYKNPFKIYSNNVNKDKDKEITNVLWMMKYYNEKGEDIDLDDLGADKEKYQLLVNWMPKLTDDNKLIPSSMYLQRDVTDTEVANIFPVVICLQNTDTVLWAQPIYMMQNRYASAMLNAWDGSLCIDHENGTIMAPMVGAGRKTRNNTFEGVLMGDVGGQVHADNATGIGLYGYHDGYQSFHFGIDGTAFIGKSGRGRIMFDGNSGTIASASWTASKQDVGMCIDLDDGIIDLRGAMVAESNYNATQKAYIGDGYATHIQLHAMPDEDLGEAYFLITTPNSKNYQNADGEYDIWIDKPLIKIGKTEYFLQTEDYKSSTLKMGDKGTADDYGSGMKIDLSEGTIDAYNFVLKGESNSGDYAGSFIKLASDPNGFIDAYLLDPSLGGIHVLDIGLDNYQLHSFDWYVKDSTRQGMEIDLNEGCITSYSNSNENKAMIFDASASTYPFQIGTIGNYNFKIRWDGGFAVNGTAFKVDASGNLNIGSNFSVSNTGIMRATGAFLTDLTVTNDATFQGSITSTGNASFQGTAYFGGATTIGGTLTTQSTVTLGGNTTVSGTIVTTGTADFGGSTTVDGELTTTGQVTLGGNTTVSGTLETTGEVTLGGNTTVSGDITVDGGANFGKDSEITGTLTVSGDIDITGSGSLSVAGDTDITGKADITGDTTIGGSLKVTGAVEFENASFTVNGTPVLNEAVDVLVDAPWFNSAVRLYFENGLLKSYDGEAHISWEDFWGGANDNGASEYFPSKEEFESLKTTLTELKAAYDAHVHTFSGSDSDSIDDTYRTAPSLSYDSTGKVTGWNSGSQTYHRETVSISISGTTSGPTASE